MKYRYKIEIDRNRNNDICNRKEKLNLNYYFRKGISLKAVEVSHKGTPTILTGEEEKRLGILDIEER